MTLPPRPHDLLQLASATAILADESATTHPPGPRRVLLAPRGWSCAARVPCPAGSPSASEVRRGPSAGQRACRGPMSSESEPPKTSGPGTTRAPCPMSPRHEPLDSLPRASTTTGRAGDRPGASDFPSPPGSRPSPRPVTSICSFAAQSDPRRGWLDRVARRFAGQEVRVDCQLETPVGIAHLDDLRRHGPSLVRTSAGARLCADPWAPLAS